MGLHKLTTNAGKLQKAELRIEMRDRISIETSSDGLSIIICADQTTKVLLQPVIGEMFKTLTEIIEVATTTDRFFPDLEKELIGALREVRTRATDLVDAKLDQMEMD